ncbi:hypothetical protein GWN42_31395 [candidate division KSB1 bacterium]|nr:hypothetical protein [Phycisphaerae bacterium]NIQ92565.1 hypothetical protein [Deltaproteobacteria bacterium]NIV97175.1 hypothetical protein [candidate division KSB1 bacterium]
MNYRTVKQNLTTLLESGEIAGGYKTLGYKPRKLGMEEIFDGGGIVQVRFSRGNFFNPTQQGSSKFDAFYDIELLVASKTTADLSVLNNPDATDADRASALIASTDAAKNCDDRMDELIDYVYQLVMDTNNRYLNSDGIVTSRSINDVQKYDPESSGSFVLLNALMELRVEMTEDVRGIEDVPDAIQPGDSTITGIIASDGTDDDPAPAGVEVIP